MEPIDVIEPPPPEPEESEDSPSLDPPELDPEPESLEVLEPPDEPPLPVHPARPPSVTADPPMAVFCRKRRLDWLLLSRTMFATP
jgi:hypothetical protein